MVPWRCLLLAVRRRVIPSRAAPMFQVNVTRLVTLHCRNRLALGCLLLLVSSPLPPNAGRQPLPEAGATQERTLEAVGWTPWLGCRDTGDRNRLTIGTLRLGQREG